MPMDLVTDRALESASPFESMLVSPPEDDRSADVHVEINQRRAQVEDPEMLRRLRSL